MEKLQIKTNPNSVIFQYLPLEVTPYTKEKIKINFEPFEFSRAAKEAFRFGASSKLEKDFIEWCNLTYSDFEEFYRSHQEQLPNDVLALFKQEIKKNPDIANKHVGESRVTVEALSKFFELTFNNHLSAYDNLNNVRFKLLQILNKNNLGSQFLEGIYTSGFQDYNQSILFKTFLEDYIKWKLGNHYQAWQKNPSDYASILRMNQSEHVNNMLKIY